MPITPNPQPTPPAVPQTLIPPGPPPTTVTVTGQAPIVRPTPPAVPQKLTAPAPTATASLTPTNRQGWLGKVFQTLAGGARTEYSVDPQTGQMTETKVPLKPGEMFRGILAGALTGLAAGATEHGPHAGMEALGAGYVGRSEQLQQQDTLKRQEAQQEFQNEGEAQTRTLQLHADYRAQQASIRDAQTHQMQMKLWQAQLSNDNFQNAQNVLAAHEKQVAQWNADAALGLTPLAVNGQPLPEFNSPDDAWAYLQQNPGLIKSAIGNGQTRLRLDPQTMQYAIMVKPPDSSDLKWYGAKMDPNNPGKPLRDKAGGVIPDGSLKDSSGKPFAARTTLDKALAYQERYLQSQLAGSEIAKNYADALDQKADARSRTTALTQSKQLGVAWDQYNAAISKGGVDAVDSKGQPILSPASRRILANSIDLEIAKESSQIEAARKDLSNNMLTPEEQAQAQQAVDVLTQRRNNDLALSNSLKAPNPAYVENYIKGLNAKYGTDTGAKLDAIDADPNLSPENRQKIRETVTGTVAVPGSANPASAMAITPAAQEAYDEVVGRAEKFSGGLTPVERYQEIQKLQVSSDQKIALAAAHGAQVPWSAVEQLAAQNHVDPSQVAANLRSRGLNVQPQPPLPFSK